MSPASYQTAPPRDVDADTATADTATADTATADTATADTATADTATAASRPADPPDRALTGALRAGNGTRTRDPNLGKVVLYQLSYSREADRILAPGPPGRNAKTAAMAAPAALGWAVEWRRGGSNP
jgi:hypothetical protein